MSAHLNEAGQAAAVPLVTPAEAEGRPIDLASGDRIARWTWLAAILVACGVFTVVALWRHLGAGRDDMFITVWAGAQVGHHPWFVNHNFELEEISSSILHALVVRGLLLVSPDFIYLTNKLFGLLCAAILLVALVRYRRTLFGSDRLADPLTAATVLLTASSPAFAYWALGGQETPIQALVLGLYGIALLSYLRTHPPRAPHVLALVTLQALHVLVRAEGFWIVPLTAGLLFVLRPLSAVRRRDVLVVLAPAAFVAALFAVRYHFTGVIFPNPTYAKIDSLGGAILYGAKYLWDYYTASVFAPLHAVAMAYAGFTLLRAGAAFITGDRAVLERRLTAIVVSAVAVTCDLFALLAGGNWMEYYRFLVPAILFKNILLVLLARDLLARDRTPLLRRRLVPAACAATLLLSVDQHFTHWPNHRLHAWNQSTPVSVEWLRDRATDPMGVLDLNDLSYLTMRDLAPFIRGPMRQYLEQSGRLTVVSFQAGLFPVLLREQFPVEQVKFIDSMGLTTKSVALLPLEKNAFGLVDGWDFPAILANRKGALSAVILAHDPNMVFKPLMAPGFRQALEDLGWVLVWDRPMAVVYWKPPR